jgi:hypothetical protein
MSRSTRSKGVSKGVWQMIDLTNEYGKPIQDFVQNYRDSYFGGEVIGRFFADKVKSFERFWVAQKEERVVLLSPFQLTYHGNLFSSTVGDFFISANILTSNGIEKTEKFYAGCPYHLATDMRKLVYENKPIREFDGSASNGFSVYVMDVDVREAVVVVSGLTVACMEVAILKQHGGKQ